MHSESGQTSAVVASGHGRGSIADAANTVAPRRHRGGVRRAAAAP